MLKVSDAIKGEYLLSFSANVLFNLSRLVCELEVSHSFGVNMTIYYRC